MKFFFQFAGKEKNFSHMIIFQLFIYLFYCFSQNVRTSYVDAPQSCTIPFSDNLCRHSRSMRTIYCDFFPLKKHRQSLCQFHPAGKYEFDLKDLLIFYKPYSDIMSPYLTNYVTTYTMEFDLNTDHIIMLDLRSIYEGTIGNTTSIYFWVLRGKSDVNLYIREYKNLSLLTAFTARNKSIQLDITHKNKMFQEIMVTNQSLCKHFNLKFANNTLNYTYNIVSCPFSNCLLDKTINETCIGSIVCEPTSFYSITCQIDRLLENDQFYTNIQIQYDYVVIITTNTNINTSHIFSKQLIESCITHRLIIIVLNGQLDIPFFDSTSIDCTNGLVGSMNRFFLGYRL